MKTAVIYARYSSDSQSEQSIEGQLRVCEQYAKNNDILILNTYIDRAMTGTNDNRPDFQKMIRESNSKEFESIIVYKIDRFSRNKYETAKYKKILKDNGVKLLSATENIPDTPEGIILESLLEGMAEYYSAELAQKVSRGMKETRLKGFFQGGFLPFGYKLDGRKIVIDETKLEIVKSIFEQYANGVFVKDIMKDLNEKGILNKGKPFARNTLYKMLKNENYTGIYRKDNVVYDNMYPRIIDDETFSKTRSKRKINFYGRRCVRTTFLLRHKLVCGYCGMPISAESGTSKSGKKMNYYKCSGIKKLHNGCIRETVRQNDFEQFILDVIISELSKPQNKKEMVKNILKEQSENSKNSSNLSSLKKRKTQAENSLNNIMQAVEQGVINKTTNSRMKALEEQIEDLEKQMLIERSRMSIQITEKEINQFFEEALRKEPLLLIDQLINKIKVYNDKIEILFNTPIIQSPDKQGFLFLQKIKCFTKYIPNQMPCNQEIIVSYLF